jgi:hypothetical protein
MLTRSETEDLKTSLLRQCPGPPECRCKFCATRGVIAAYERVAALLAKAERENAEPEHGPPYVAFDELYRALEG